MLYFRDMSDNNIDNTKENNISSAGNDYSAFKLGAILERQNQEIASLKTTLSEEKEKRIQDIEVLKTSVIQELAKQKEEESIHDEEKINNEFKETMEWLKQNEGTQQFNTYIEDPVNFIAYYLYSRGLIQNMTDWSLLRQTTFKNINEWKDILKILEYRHAPLSNSNKMRLTEVDMNFE